MSGRGMVVEDLLRMRWANDPRISPDGSNIAFTVKEVDDSGKGYQVRIHTLPFSGDSEPTQMTDGPNDSAPRWSPCGTSIAYLSNASGRTQIWLHDIATGESRQLTAEEGGVSSAPVWSPSGSHIAFTSRFLDEELGTESLIDDDSGRSLRVIKRLYYKSDGAGYWDGRRNHICIIEASLKDTPAAGRRMTSGCFDHGSPTWSPDGSMLAFSADRSEYADWTRESYIWTIPVDLETQDVPEPKHWSLDKGTSGAPAWSPCGRYIAYIGNDGSENRGSNDGLWVVDTHTGDLVNLTFDWDRSLGDTVLDDMNTYYGAGSNPPVWFRDGSRIAFLATDMGDTQVFSVKFPGEQAFSLGMSVSHGWTDEKEALGQTFGVTPLTAGSHRVFSFDFDGADRLALAESRLDNISDLVTVTLNPDLSADPAQITNLNASLLEEVSLGGVEPMSFTGACDREIHGWLLHPPDFDPSKKYPLLFYIHGGPYSTYGHSFIHEFQVHAARGYCVLYTNPHGSKGYGLGLLSEYALRRGEVDTYDQLKAVDEATKRDYLDRDNIFLTGGSYAGWAVNWLITKTDRFRAAVSQRGTCNRHASWGNSQAGFLHSDWECPAPPWEDYDFYMRISPINFADKVTTPLLLIHSENDALCNVSEAEQFFTALKYLKKEVEWVLFLRENHGLSRSGSPPNRMERIRRIYGWFDRYQID